MNDHLAIGIDLGTTFSTIAHLDENGKPVTIPNAEGELITPSAVFFEGEMIVVGREAKQAAFSNPDEVVLHIKRHMGTNYTFDYNQLAFKPENISALILKKLKQDASDRVGEIKEAVITVPAFFDDTRRKATQDAGQIAGIKVLDILNEPSAAALAYGINMLDKPETVLVYDLGGGTFDVTLVRIGDGKINTLATDGDVRLGGADWDERIARHAAKLFKKEHGIDPCEDKHAYQELLLASENAKKALSKRTKATLFCNHAGKFFKMELNRNDFEDLTRDLLFCTESTTSLTLAEANLTWQQIDRVLLIGGSTRMPMVGHMLERVTGIKPENKLPVDEMVAHGAAIYAGLLSEKATPGISTLAAPKKQVEVINVNSHSLGIVVRSASTNKNVNIIMIPKNTPLPYSQARVFKTPKPGATNISIPIVEGESSNPEACIQIGKCVIRDLPSDLPKGAPVQVVYEYKSDSRIHVQAVDMTSGQETATEIVRQSGLSCEDVEKKKEQLQNICVE